MRYLLLACAAGLMISSCNKEQTMEVPKTRTQMLYGSNTTNAADAMPTSWKTKEYRVIYTLPSGKDTTRTDLYPECKKDDFLQFFENYSGKHHTEGNKCSTNEGDIYNFRWEFTQNETYLNFYNADRLFNERTFIAEVADFSEGGFTLKVTVPMFIDNQLDTVRVEHVFEKK
jgi:hypothetical protein